MVSMCSQLVRERVRRAGREGREGGREDRWGMLRLSTVRCGRGGRAAGRDASWRFPRERQRRSGQPSRRRCRDAEPKSGLWWKSRWRLVRERLWEARQSSTESQAHVSGSTEESRFRGPPSRRAAGNAAECEWRLRRSVDVELLETDGVRPSDPLPDGRCAWPANRETDGWIERTGPL